MKGEHAALWVVLAAAVVYTADANNYHLYLLTTGALTVIVAVGLNVLFGLSGLVSFGHVGFYALGAYTAAILTTAVGWSFWADAAGRGGHLRRRGPHAGDYGFARVGPLFSRMVTIAFGFIVDTALSNGRR